MFRDNGEKDREIWDELNGVFDKNPNLKLLSAKLSRWLVIVNAMLDVGVNRLPPLFLYGGMEKEFHEFVSTLYRCNTHLKELSVTFQVRIHCYLYFLNIFIYSYAILISLQFIQFLIPSKFIIISDSLSDLYSLHLSNIIVRVMSTSLAMKMPTV